MTENKDLQQCPVAITVNLIGYKWKLLIIRELLTGTKRFSELHKGVDGISEKVLTENLRRMEDDGLINRKVYPVVPPKVEYSLSELGDTLRPIIDVMGEWGTSYLNEELV